MTASESVPATSHTAVPNPKNASILVSRLAKLISVETKTFVQVGMRDGVTGKFKTVPREQAVVSVFDSNFLVGDGIWVSAARPSAESPRLL